MNYFILFNLPEIFNLKKKKIKQKFYTLQKKYHPDFHINTKNHEKYIKKSIEINQGYKTLINPLKRIEHLLSLNINYNLYNKKNKRDNEIIKFQFNLYEKFEYYKKKNNHTMLKNFLDKINKLENSLFNKIEKNIKKKNWEKSIFLLKYIKFINTFQIFVKKNI
ncbi:Fe-S protein assembly co-chaperone HscB [Buchnera aphidicola (Kurisakia onigurumii)]|uniref:Fe-S protein assembly co-chaperone HscB n=1 Tax=Buchnera aphidicola TaxID=9 RepID=UPI0031B73A2B